MKYANVNIRKFSIALIVFLIAVSKVSANIDVRAVAAAFPSHNAEDRKKMAEQIVSELSVSRNIDQLRSSGVGSVLVHNVEAESDPHVKANLIFALGYLKDATTYRSVANVARSHSENIYAKLPAIEVLPNIDRTQCHADLVVVLNADQNPLARLRAAKKLAELGDAIGKPEIAKGLGSSNPIIKREAIVALGFLPPVSSASDLQRIANSSDPASGIAIGSLLQSELNQISQESDKLLFLNQALTRGRAAAEWASQQLAQYKSIESAQILLTAARQQTVPGSNEKDAQQAAYRAFLTLYPADTQEEYRKIQQMLQTGVALTPD